MSALAKAVSLTRHILLALGMATTFGVSSLSAATVSYSTTLPEVAFANPTANSTIGSTAVLDQNVFGSVTNQRRSPWDAENSTLDYTVPTAFYSAIRSDEKSVQASAVYNFNSVMGALSLVWGSPGAKNQLEFLLDGSSQLTLSGAAPQSATGRLSVLLSVTDIQFNQLVFSADHRAFEYANLSVVPVPLPAGLPLLGAGLLALGLLRRCRRA